MNILKPVSLAAILFSATPALAFDEHRQGFILGLGAGFHSTSLDFTRSGFSPLSQSKSGLATSFKIGAGITDQFALYYVRNASWYSAPYSNNGTTKDALYTIGLSGIGASYFLAPSAPSGYILGAFGVGDLAAPFEKVNPDTGSAFMFGGGYEFNNHLMFEATLLKANIQGSGFNPTTLKSSSLQFTINYLFY